jgi:hypothetical protein
LVEVAAGDAGAYAAEGAQLEPVGDAQGEGLGLAPAARAVEYEHGTGTPGVLAPATGAADELPIDRG